MKADLYSLFVYLGGLAITMLLCRVFQQKRYSQGKYKWLSLIIISLPLSLVAGLRDNVGTDYSDYVRIIDTVKNLNFVDVLSFENPLNLEPGYLLITKLCLLIHAENMFLPFFTYSFLTIFFALAGFDRFREKISLPFAFFLFYILFYHVTLNIIRQGICVWLLIYAFKDLCEKNYIRYITIAIIAYLIHRTSILFLLFLIIPLVSGKFTKEGTYIEGSRRIFGFLAFIIFFSVASISLYASLIESGYFFSRGNYEVNENAQVGSGLGVFIFFCINIFFIIVLERNYLKKHVESAIARDMAYLFVPIQTMGYFFPYVERLILYVNVAFIFVILFSSKEKRYGTIVIWYSVLTYGYKYVTSILIEGQTDTVPYHALSIF